jgi:hypothetical protein
LFDAPSAPIASSVGEARGTVHAALTGRAASPRTLKTLEVVGGRDL